MESNFQFGDDEMKKPNMGFKLFVLILSKQGNKIRENLCLLIYPGWSNVSLGSLMIAFVVTFQDLH